MAGYQIETDAETALMRLGAKPLEIVVCPVPGRDFVKISDIIAGVAERGLEHRIKPNRVTADGSDVIELRRQAG